MRSIVTTSRMTSANFSDAIWVVAECTSLIFVSRSIGKIRFDDASITEGITALSAALADISTKPEPRRSQIYQHWKDHGFTNCAMRIERVAARDEKTMVLADVTDLLNLDKPPIPAFGVRVDFDKLME